MKVKLPGWLYLLLLLDAASIILLIGTGFGGWTLPEWLERLAPLVPTLTMVVWGIWEFKPGGVWGLYETRKKEQAKSSRKEMSL